jgi:hypothetical protein
MNMYVHINMNIHIYVSVNLCNMYSNFHGYLCT